MARKIVVTSGKGGVGKTTIVSALGVAFARLGAKVLLVDMDFGLNNLDILMNIENKIVYDIIDVLEGKCDARQAVIQDFYESNLYILPTTHGFCKVRFGARELMYIISTVEVNFDIVLIDCPAGIDGGFRRAIGCASEFIVVTTPHLSAIRDAHKALKVINDDNKKIIVNRVRGDLILENEMLSIENIKDFLKEEIVGIVPDDDTVALQLYNGDQWSRLGSFFESVQLIAKNIMFGENILFDCTKKYRGIIGGFRRKVKRRV